jgi:hypothetical protein
VAEIEQPAQEAVLIGRRKRNPCVQMGVTACPNTRPRRPYGRIVSRPMETTPRSDRSTATSSRYGSRAGDPKRLQPPLKSQTAEARPAWAATSADKAISRRRQCLVRRRARGSKRHTRPGRCRHDDCARNCYCLSPTFSGYTNVRESECGMISSDSSW